MALVQDLLSVLGRSALGSEFYVPTADAGGFALLTSNLDRFLRLPRCAHLGGTDWQADYLLSWAHIRLAEIQGGRRQPRPRGLMSCPRPAMECAHRGAERSPHFGRASSTQLRRRRTEPASGEAAPIWIEFIRRAR